MDARHVDRNILGNVGQLVDATAGAGSRLALGGSRAVDGDAIADTAGRTAGWVHRLLLGRLLFCYPGSGGRVVSLGELSDPRRQMSNQRAKAEAGAEKVKYERINQLGPPPDVQTRPPGSLIRADRFE